MDILIMDALMIGTLLAGFGLLRLFLGWYRPDRRRKR